MVESFGKLVIKMFFVCEVAILLVIYSVAPIAKKVQLTLIRSLHYALFNEPNIVRCP